MTTQILLPSIQSLYLEIQFNELFISTATGFIVQKNNKYYLITNRHVVTGRDNFTNEPLNKTHSALPNKVHIWHNIGGKGMLWSKKAEPLYDGECDIYNNKPLWIEHPILGEKADVIALPLTNTDGVDFYPYNPEEKITLKLQPTDILSVVGFPFGDTASGKDSCGKHAIWATGFLATEPSIDYRNLPMFLIDCRTREGQSGSAVIAHRNGGANNFTNGNTIANGMPITQFVGVYSGRIRIDSDIGMVWKAKIINELLEKN